MNQGRRWGLARCRNSNRVLLCSWLQRLGCEVIDAGILPDDLTTTRARLGELKDVDLILSTGGVSVGEADFLGIALREEGELALWKLAIKPGKPLTFGHFRGVPVIGLPGNPASTLVTFALLTRPYLLRRQGVKEVEPLKVQVQAGFDFGSKPAIDASICAVDWRMVGRSSTGTRVPGCYAAPPGPMDWLRCSRIVRLS